MAGGVLSRKTLLSHFRLPRYERPQAGRLREFHQFGVELYGAAGPQADAETILLADLFLRRLGLKQIKLELNSIGCRQCRTAYNEALRDYFRPHLEEMCAGLPRARFEKNPMRMLDCKEEGCRRITAGAPRILDYLCADCRAHFEEVRSLLDAAGVAYEVNPSIVRGLDYYSRTVFEFTTSAVGAQGTVCAAGGKIRFSARTDGRTRRSPRVRICGGAGAPADGAGSRRRTHARGKQGGLLPSRHGRDEPPAVFPARGPRCAGAGIPCEVDLMDRSVKSQFKYADKTGARFVAVVGESELSAGAAEVKDMRTSSSERVAFEQLAQYIFAHKNKN